MVSHENAPGAPVWRYDRAMTELEPDASGQLTLLLQFGGDPAETRVFARDGRELPDWQFGPVLGDALAQLQQEGWKVSEGRLWRRAETLFPVPILVLHRPADVPAA
jgi:hypothetical protein